VVHDESEALLLAGAGVLEAAGGAADRPERGGSVYEIVVDDDHSRWETGLNLG
jgi:hypothetical protein